MVPSVFISYRRDDTAELSDVLAHDLKQDLGLANVFRDTDDLRPGVEFAVEIERRLAEAAITVALVGRGWSGGGGVDRLVDDDDWVRRELRTTFVLGRELVPVLVDGAALPASLPTDIERLRALQALHFDSQRYPECYQELLAAVWYLTVTSADEREIILVADDSTEARLALDRLIDAMDAEETPGARALSRIAVGLRAVTVVDAEHRWPDVIVVAGPDPGETQWQRLQGIASRRRVQRVALIALGGIIGGVGVTVADLIRSAETARRAVEAGSPVGAAPDVTTATYQSVAELAEAATGTGATSGGMAGASGGTATSVKIGLVVAGASVAAFGVAAALPDGAGPAAAPPTAAAVVAETDAPPSPTPASTPPADPLKRATEPPPGIDATVATVRADPDACTVTLRGTNEEVAPDAATAVDVPHGDPVIVCARDFFPYDVPIEIVGPDGIVWSTGELVYDDGGQDVEVWNRGVGWGELSVSTASARLGDHVVEAQLPDEQLREIAAEITRAAAARVDTFAERGGQRAVAVVTVVERPLPHVAATPTTARRGATIDFMVTTDDPGTSIALHLYRHTGRDLDDPTRELWSYVTALEVGTDATGVGTAQLASRNDDPAGRYLAVASSDLTGRAEFTLE